MALCGTYSVYVHDHDRIKVITLKILNLQTQMNPKLDLVPYILYIVCLAVVLTSVCGQKPTVTSNKKN